MKETIVLTYPIGSAGSTNYPVLIKLRCRVKPDQTASTRYQTPFANPEQIPDQGLV